MPSKDAIIAELRKLVEEQAKQIEALTQEVADLKLQLAWAKKDSSNSSKSPSSDITRPKKPRHKPGRPKKRKAGGQTVHKRSLRQPLPAERITKTIDHELDKSEIDRLGLTANDQFDCIQHIELPETPLIVTEHRFRLYQAPDGSNFRERLPLMIRR